MTRLRMTLLTILIVSAVSSADAQGVHLVAPQVMSAPHPLGHVGFDAVRLSVERGTDGLAVTLIDNDGNRVAGINLPQGGSARTA